jgi:hypothetical protein
MARCDQDPILHSKLIRLLMKIVISGEITNFFNNLTNPDQIYTGIRNCSLYTLLGIVLVAYAWLRTPDRGNRYH